MVFFTSDHHFSDENIIKYCLRPWRKSITSDGILIPDVKSMDKEMIKRWNNVVRDGDTVWYLGDFCCQTIPYITRIFKQLNGKINLVLGNHDPHTVKDYYDIGFNRVYDCPIVVDDFYILSHKPLQWIGNQGVYVNIFGHVHNQKYIRTITENSACVCVERWNYTPVSFCKIRESIFNSREK